MNKLFKCIPLWSWRYNSSKQKIVLDFNPGDKKVYYYSYYNYHYFNFSERSESPTINILNFPAWVHAFNTLHVETHPTTTTTTSTSTTTTATTTHAYSIYNDRYFFAM